jgi:hypothetical protein
MTAADIAHFPAAGWHRDSSNSYGKAELYYAIPRVVVNVFPEPERNVAEGALRSMRDAGVKSARLFEAQHTDGRKYLYVFAEENDFLAFRDRLLPHVQVSG